MAHRRAGWPARAPHPRHGVHHGRGHAPLRSARSIRRRHRRRAARDSAGMSSRPGTAVVIGAGIVGAACARELARAGMSVTVLDAGYAGGGTTAAGMGHLVAMDDSPEQLALTALSVRLWHELRPSLGASLEFDPCGTIWVAERDEHMVAVREKAEVYRAHGLECEVLTPTRLAALEPNLRLGVAGGLLVPGDAVLYPPGGALALLDDARAHGATLHEGCAVDEIGPHA